ncbi:Alpha/Beta hydrolase protein [Rhexocercosporidium sp. MPI-PUGE-AT-0058]|nr:Alpha/Beta hydrolase protein [Rhexocercosporidium sp. MPI-PUGE-AT-0058]
MHPLLLQLRAILVRAILSILTFLDLYLSHPLPQRPSFIRKIKSTESYIPGTVSLLFYTSLSYKWNQATHHALLASEKRRPLLVNFHGGGFTVGHARDDARWATAVTSQTDAVVVSVNYRLAPEHPFPVAIDDCVSAILWLWRHADEFNIDISRTAMSGFSAGGNLTYAVSLRLYELSTTYKREDGLGGLRVPRGNIVSLAVFYGSTDWTQTRAEREASNPDLIHTTPPRLYKLFDEAYLSSKPDMRSPFLSPGLAGSKLLRDALPERLVLINCSGDQLLAESEQFRNRLVGLGKKVDGCVMEGVGHGWDKKPTFRRGDAKRDEAYRLAIESLQMSWARL